jgi:hypothetical protein
MTASYSKRFLKQYAAAPKKYNEALDLWQARVNRDWRFYFTIEGEVYHLHEIVKHPK